MERVLKRHRRIHDHRVRRDEPAQRRYIPCQEAAFSNFSEQRSLLRHRQQRTGEWANFHLKDTVDTQESGQVQELVYALARWALRRQRLFIEGTKKSCSSRKVQAGVQWTVSAVHGLACLYGHGGTRIGRQGYEWLLSHVE